MEAPKCAPKFPSQGKLKPHSDSPRIIMVCAGSPEVKHNCNGQRNEAQCNGLVQGPYGDDNRLCMGLKMKEERKKERN